MGTEFLAWLGRGGDLPMLLLLVGTGAYCSVKLRGFPLLWPRRALGALRHAAQSAGGVSPREALCTALAGTVGTGNIVGVAGAIALGGPGAVFWMWCAALLGTATKYAEIVLTLETRVRLPDGTVRGGPMIAMRRLGRFGKWLAALFGSGAILASFGIGNAVQMHTLSSLLRRGTISDVLLGGTVALLVSILGRDPGRVGRTAARLVPWMGALYLGLASVVVVRYFEYLPRVLWEIVRAALCPRAVLGGSVGVLTAFRCGAARGVFSNEAGLGSAPLAHASVETDSPVRQGVIGSLEVLLVTAVCTVTALVLLLPAAAMAYEIPYGTSCGAELVIAALGTVLPAAVAKWLLGAVLACFAVSSVLSWRLYGERCAAALLGDRAVRWYRLLFGAALLCSARLPAEPVWTASELLNAWMATPNLLSLLLLLPTVTRATRSFFRKAVETDAGLCYNAGDSHEGDGHETCDKARRVRQRTRRTDRAE